MREYIILGVTDDEYELPMSSFLSVKEMAKSLCVSLNHAYCMLCRKSKHKETNLRYIKVEVEEC